MLYATIIEAIDPITGELLKFKGPNVEAISHQDAYDIVCKKGMPYVKPIGAIITDWNGDSTERYKMEN